MPSISKKIKLILHASLLIYATIALGLGLVLERSFFSFFFRPVMLYVMIPVILFGVPVTYVAANRRKLTTKQRYFSFAWYLMLAGYMVGFLFKRTNLSVFLYISFLFLLCAIVLLTWRLFANLRAN